MKISEKKEAYPLSWPTDWPRTRPQDQKLMASWKRTANDYREELAKELDRSKVVNAVISTMVPLNLRNWCSKTQPGSRTPGYGSRIVWRKLSSVKWNPSRTGR